MGSKTIDEPAEAAPVKEPPPAPVKQTARIPWESDPALSAFSKSVAALPPQQQEKAVADELKKHNPGFDGLATTQIFRGAITNLEFRADGVEDLAPVRALPGLRRLTCAGSGPGKSRLADIAPLKGLPLVYLNADHTKIADLGPLRGMPLEFLYLVGVPATDLTPLKGLPLKELRWDFRPEQGANILRSFPTLKQINGAPAESFLKKKDR